MTYCRGRRRLRVTSATSRSRSGRRPRTSTATSAPAAASAPRSARPRPTSEFDEGLAERKAIYTPFPQAVPNKPVLDAEHCTYFLKDGKCGICAKVCPLDCIDYEQKDEIVEEEVGAIVVATGYDLYPIEQHRRVRRREVPGRRHEPPVRAHALRIRTRPAVRCRRPSDGEVPKEVVFLTCVRLARPREPPAVLLEGLLHVPDQARDALQAQRARGSGLRLLHGRADRRQGLRGVLHSARPRRTTSSTSAARSRRSSRRTGRSWSGASTRSRARRSRSPPTWSCSVWPRFRTPAAAELANKLKIHTNEWGFLSEAHPKLRPVESLAPGFYLAGAAQGPKDIPEAVAQASAAASKVCGALRGDGVPSRAHHRAASTRTRAPGCRVCVSVCPYDAAEFDDEKKVARIQEAICEGCGACIAACPSGSASQKNLTDEQIYKMVSAALED